MAMYDNNNTVQTSFDLSFITEYLQQAQWAELIELKKIITELFNQKKSPIRIFDIGIGNARVPKHLHAIREIWEMIEVYDGIDNAKACVDISNSTARELNNEWTHKYDLVVCTWFTPGNFYLTGFDFENYLKDGKRLNLESNPNFVKVFEGAYGLLVDGGQLVLGATYIDSDATRIKQEEAYTKMRMQVITDADDSFTATKEGFWSQRFTREKLINYLSFAPAEKISFTHLDTYEYALQVCVKK
jgi:hypothetical protein